MSIRSTIRSFLAIGILLVFAFSVMPKVYLHALFADHHDVVTKVEQTGEAQLDAGGYSCDINDQVATSPFTGELLHVQIQDAPLFPTPTTQHLLTNLRMQMVTEYGLRGPPALA